MKNLIVLGIILIVGIILVYSVHAASDITKGRAAYPICQACHGADGMGNKLLNAPQIAGQSTWYLKRQLNHFKAGIRGANSKDKYGMQMRPMALTLPTDQAVDDMAAYVSRMPVKNTSATVKGDVEAGKKSYMLCQACHGTNGEGNKALNSPRLAGQHDWYLVRQIKNFKAGIRGTKSDDIYGAQMRPMAMILADDKAINDVATYIATFK